MFSNIEKTHIVHAAHAPVNPNQARQSKAFTIELCSSPLTLGKIEYIRQDNCDILFEKQVSTIQIVNHLMALIQVNQ